MNKEIIGFLIDLKNYSLMGKESVNFKYNKLSQSLDLLLFLYKEGLIQGFNIQNNTLTVYLRYFETGNQFLNLKIFSTPSRTKILRYTDICKIRLDKVIYVIYTDKGIKSLYDCKKERLGGKILCCFS